MMTCACLSSNSFAQQVEPKKPVSKAFLNYLAELEQVDGKWVHPTELSEIDKEGLLSKQSAKNKESTALKESEENKEKAKKTSKQQEDKQ